MIEAMKLALDVLENNKRTHYYCEDTWYSCPKHEDGCANEAEGHECNCGADEANAEIGNAITVLRQAIKQKQEPHIAFNAEVVGYVAPQRQPLSDEQITKCYETTGHYQTLRPQDRFAVFALARAIEQAHGIKGDL
jgi:hypothetical protein